MAISVSACHNPRWREIRDDKKVDKRQTTGELQVLRARQKSETGGLEQYLETSKPTLVKQFDGEGGEFGRNHKKHPTTSKPYVEESFGTDAEGLRRFSVTYQDCLEESKPTVDTMFRIKPRHFWRLFPMMAMGGDRKRREYLEKIEPAILDISGSRAYGMEN